MASESPPLPPGNRRIRVLAGVFLVLVLLLIGLSATTFGSPFKYVSEVVDQPRYRTETVQVAAVIVRGSLQREGDTARFRLTDGLREMNVSHRGPLPGIFREDLGVVAIGRLGPDGTFEADRLAAKCPSKYEETIRSRMNGTPP
ncbi:MAG: cytochrome c maturation protein CcmE [Euryarchaeota archaeon]|nr:cytochrome c maturation protein CcmE [Euryarchaeota archaeon]